MIPGLNQYTAQQIRNEPDQDRKIQLFNKYVERVQMTDPDELKLFAQMCGFGVATKARRIA